MRPSATGSWGWRVEGHHVSLQFTIVNGGVTVSAPTFFGSNPAEVREGDRRGLRVLGFEEDPARALLNGLRADQRAKAVLSADAPTDILTMTKNPIEPLAPAGIVASDMDPAQRSRKLTKFSSAKYVFPKALMADLRAGLEASVARHLPQARVLYFT